MRRSFALIAGALVLAVPTLSSCGFHYATDEIYTPSAGRDIRTSQVDVLNAVIVSNSDNSGSFVATFSNNNTTAPDQVTSIAGGSSDPTFQAPGFSPTTVAPGGYVSLADRGGVPVTGTFTTGDFVTVTIDFANAQSVTFDVPVVAPTDEYSGLAPSNAPQ